MTPRQCDSDNPRSRVNCLSPHFNRNYEAIDFSSDGAVPPQKSPINSVNIYLTMSARAIPIVVGVGEVKNRSQKVEDAIEPLHLMFQSIQEAVKDTGLSESGGKSLQAAIDSVSVVAPWSWNYHDLPGLVAEKLGVESSYKTLSEHSGTSPARLFDEAARRISFGESKVAVVTGGEALASREFGVYW